MSIEKALRNEFLGATQGLSQRVDALERRVAELEAERSGGRPQAKGAATKTAAPGTPK